MLEFIRQPWAWYVAGPIIALTMFLLLFFGKSFGLSSNLRTICAMGGGGKYSEFFNFDWKLQAWNLVFVLGATTGGFIAVEFLHNPHGLEVSENVLQELATYGIHHIPDEVYISELFGWDALFSLRGIIMLVGGGFLIGFGTRYAGGCTSGHAISGLSDMQLPSLIAVVGFFIGGLTMTYFLLPYILTL